MPFVTEPHRKSPDMTIPGDRCFLAYKHMMEEWNKERCWTTADRLMEEVFTKSDPDMFRAAFLAYLVFFIKHVMKYEEEKIQENGDIL